jgi:leucyl-tRNA synthetase
MAPPDKDLEWSYEGLEGMWRFLNRLWRAVDEIAATPAGAGTIGDDGAGGKALRRATAAAISKCGADVERFQLNTAISALMEYVNAVYDYRRDVPEAAQDGALLRQVATDLVLLVAPFAPHMTEELWTGVLGNEGSVHRQTWPQFDASALVADEVELPVQVNGKVRDRVVVAADASQDEIIAAALALPNVLTYTADKTVKKVVIVPGKLVSVVVG